MDPYSAEPEYTVFLSYSVAQKSFVKELFEALKQKHISIFFDKGRLSLGEEFPKKLERLAATCRVALVVLSDEFLSSKWPMWEMSIFQESKQSGNPAMRIVPLFFKVSCSDLKDVNKQNTWFHSWHNCVGGDYSTRKEEFEKIVKTLDDTHGMEFRDFSTDKEFVEAVVREICKIAQSILRFDVSGVEGKDRLVQEVCQHFTIDDTEDSISSHSRFVGVYGLGGTGKTTLCKLLCNEYQKKFPAKVFYLEFDTSKTDKVRQLERQKLILRNLCEETSERVNDLQDPSQAWTLLKQKMRYEDVFLALDNVSETSEDEAEEYLNVGFSSSSRVLIISRYLKSLDRVLQRAVRAGGVARVVAMPDLQKVEAKGIFLQAAAVFQTSNFDSDQLAIVEACLKSCSFRKGTKDSESSECHYHPLCLKVLGAMLRDYGEDPVLWKAHLRGRQSFEREVRGEVFSVIGTSYDDLSVRTKQVFLDVAVFMPRGCLQLVPDRNYGQIKGRMLHWLKVLYNGQIKGRMLHWLKVLHGEDVENEVQRLRNRMILDSQGTSMHDLFREFAEVVAKSGEFGDRQSRCFYRSDATEASGLVEGDAASLVRIGLPGGRFENLDWLELQKCCQVRVLMLEGCDRLKRLDVEGMKNLNSLDVNRCVSLTEVSGMSSMQNLAWCELSSCGKLRKLTANYGLGRRQNVVLPSLQVLWSFGAACQIRLLLNLQQSSRLIEVQWIYSWTFRTLSRRISQAVRMIWHTGFQRDCLCFQNLERLEKLYLCVEDRYVSFTKIHFRGLRELRELSLQGFDEVRELVGLDALVPLRKLNIINLPKLQRLPFLSKLIYLEDLEISSCDDVTEVHGTAGLTKLVRFFIFLTKIRAIPDLSRLARLEGLFLDGIVVEAPGLDVCAAQLRRLHCTGRLLTVEVVKSCVAMERLSCVGELPATCVFKYMNCWTRLTHLRLVGVHGLVKFPSELVPLAAGLHCVDIFFCDDLTSLDHLVGVSCPFLRRMQLGQCRKLQHLPLNFFSMAPELREVSLSYLGITSLPPDLPTGCPLLKDLEISHCDELDLSTCEQLPVSTSRSAGSYHWRAAV